VCLDMSNEVKTRVTPHFSLVIDPEDGTPSKTWKLCYDYRAIAKIEESIGLDIKKLEDWGKLSSGKHFPSIVHGGLLRYNPEVTLEQVLDVLNPEAQSLLTNEIFDLMFPGAKEAYEKLRKEQQTGATADPNGQTATTSA
jgi:hypothetical protein